MRMYAWGVVGTSGCPPGFVKEPGIHGSHIMAWPKRPWIFSREYGFRHSLDARVDGCVGRTAYYYVGIATLVFKMTAPRHSPVHTIAQEKEHRVGRAVSEPRAAMVKWDTGYLSSPFEFG